MAEEFSLPSSPEICFPVTDENGEVIARVHGNPDMSEEARKALDSLIDVVRRDMEVQPFMRTIRNVERRNRTIE